MSLSWDSSDVFLKVGLGFGVSWEEPQRGSVFLTTSYQQGSPRLMLTLVTWILHCEVLCGAHSGPYAFIALLFYSHSVCIRLPITSSGNRLIWLCPLVQGQPGVGPITLAP